MVLQVLAKGTTVFVTSGQNMVPKVISGANNIIVYINFPLSWSLSSNFVSNHYLFSSLLDH